MVSCIILVGPKKLCENHKKVIQAIKITNIQALEISLNEFRNLKNENIINEGQLQKSFIIARTNNLSIENFRKNVRKL